MLEPTRSNSALSLRPWITDLVITCILTLYIIFLTPGQGNNNKKKGTSFLFTLLYILATFFSYLSLCQDVTLYLTVSRFNNIEVEIEGFENVVGKWENTSKHHFLFSLQCFLLFNPFPNNTFWTPANWESLQTTISNLMKMAESFLKGWKTLQEKEKLLIMSNFSFSCSVFKRLVLQTRNNQGLFGKGLKGKNTTEQH